jgi:pimeloyl-ACP methyl ester carboxylesterase
VRHGAVWTVAILGAGLVALALATGVVFEQVQRARDRERLPQIGRSVDIGGRTLNLFCSGTGQPAVIFASGASWPFYQQPKVMFEDGTPRPGYIWSEIQRELARSTMACWYDRAGSGWSDLGPYPRDSASQAHDLHALLQAAGVPPPYLLVAEATAALDARVFTGQYPAEVAGLVFVNAVHPAMLEAHKRAARMPGFVGHGQDFTARVIHEVGLYRFGAGNRPAPDPPKGVTASAWNTIWSLSQSSKARSALIQDIAARLASAAQAKDAGGMSDRTLAVVSTRDPVIASTFTADWMEQQADLARLSSRGKQIILPDVRSDPIYGAPNRIVEAVRQVLDQVRLP